MNLEMRLSLCRWQRSPINVKKYDNFHFEQLNEQRYRYAENEILELHSLLFALLDGEKWAILRLQKFLNDFSLEWGKVSSGILQLFTLSLHHKL